jgi:hypothetical protein
MIHFIFDADRHFLAECTISGGACVNIHLATPHVLEASIDEWQACGIPSRVEVGEHDDFMIGIERIGMRDPRFDSALRTWLLERGYLIASIPESSLPIWHLALQAPVHDTDLFEIAHLIGTSSQKRLELLQETLRRSVVSYAQASVRHPVSSSV